MKLFVTGGTGFIGSHFISQALLKNHEIKALKRSPNSITKIPLEIEPKWFQGSFNELTSGDMEGIDVLVHLAAHSANVPYDNLDNCIKYNVLEPLSLFKKAKEAGIRRILVAGTCFEYGESGERYEYIPTDAPLKPTNTYSTSKAMATLAFRSFANENRISISLQRIFQVYGVGELESRFWPSLKRAALNGENFEMTKGEQVRDFINVEDVANKLILAAEKLDEHEKPPYLSIENLGSGNPQSIYEFAKYWWHKWGAKGEILAGEVPYRKGEVMRFVPKI